MVLHGKTFHQSIKVLRKDISFRTSKAGQECSRKGSARKVVPVKEASLQNPVFAPKEAIVNLQVCMRQAVYVGALSDEYLQRVKVARAFDALCLQLRQECDGAEMTWEQLWSHNSGKINERVHLCCHPSL
eukprot:5320494-Pleurochrysis_carterae.AAC.3